MKEELERRKNWAQKKREREVRDPIARIQLSGLGRSDWMGNMGLGNFVRVED